jgi:hypothetical protein
VQVLQLVSQGKRNKEIAAILGLSEDTVSVHVKNIFAKLRVNERTAAVQRRTSPRHHPYRIAGAGINARFQPNYQASGVWDWRFGVGSREGGFAVWPLVVGSW